MELATSSSTVICPVDQTVNDLRERSQCKQCGSDLRALGLIGQIRASFDALASRPSGAASVPGAHGDRILSRARMAAWVGTALALAGLFAGLGWRIGQAAEPALSVAGQLQSQALIRQLGLQIRADAGVVKLTGVVPSEAYRQLVMVVAGGESKVDGSGLQVAKTAAPALTYLVRKGDSWWLIARNVYGDGQRWRQIQEANANASPLLPGAVLHLPLLELR